MSEEAIESLLRALKVEGEEFHQNEGDSSDKSAPSLSFPYSLSSASRRRVHEVCERLTQLAHTSHGESDARFITVTYIPSSVAVVPITVVKSRKQKKRDLQHFRTSTSSVTASAVASSSSLLSSSSSSLSSSMKPVITLPLSANASLTPLEDATEWTKQTKGGFSLLSTEEEPYVATETQTQDVKTVPSKKKQPKKQEVKLTENDDLDSLFAEFDANKCATCKVAVNTFASASFLCAFCKRNFCVQHRNAVLHGCADAHKTAARAALASSMTNTSKIKPQQQAALKLQLQKKQEAAKQSRTAKKPEK